MLDNFHRGGWGMYPTTIVGILLVITAARYAVSPERQRADLVRGLAWLTFLSSCLGFVTGVIRTFTAVGSSATDDVGGLAIAGVGESLTNIGLGLVLLAMAAVGTTIGISRRAGSTLADPHLG